MAAGAAEPAVVEDRPWLDRLYRAVPLATVFIWLVALYVWQSWHHTSPWLFTDELELSQLSRSIADTGHAARRGQPHFFESLYTYLTAPAWWIGSTARAYDVVRYIGVFTMTAVVFPTYFLARTIVRTPAALFAAAAAAAVPAMAYSQMIVEEGLAYPYAALAFLLIVKALATRRRWWIVGAIVASLVAPLVRGELAVIPVVFCTRGVLLLSHERGRSPLALGMGRVGLGRRGRAHHGLPRLLLCDRGELLPELVDRNGPLPRTDAPLRRVGCRGLHDRSRRTPGRCRPRRTRTAEGRAADSSATRVHGPSRRRGDRVRPLHGRQGLLPLDRLRNGDRRTEPHLSRAARLLRHGALARAPAAPMVAARRRDGGRRVFPRVRQLRPVERPLLGRPRALDRPDVESQPRVHGQRRAVGTDRRSRHLRVPARGPEAPSWAAACRDRRPRRHGSARPRVDAHRRDLGGEVLERLREADHEELPATALVARPDHRRRAGALPRPEHRAGRRARDLAHGVLEPLAEERLES